MPIRPDHKPSRPRRGTTSTDAPAAPMQPVAWYVLAGPDRHRRHARLRALRAALGIDMLDYHEQRGDTVQVDQLLARCREHPVASPMRLIVIDEADELDEAVLEALTRQAALLSQTACIVLLMREQPPADHPWRRLAQVETFPWLPPAEVLLWIQAAVARAGGRIEARVGQLLVTHFGADLAAIESALDQLLAWSGSEARITEAAWQALMGASARPTAAPEAAAGKGGFALVEAIGRRDVAGALRSLQEQLHGGKDIVELLGLVVWQLQRWLTVGRLAQAGMPAARIASVTGYPAWQVERAQRELAGRPVSWTLAMLRRCWQLDVASKTGRTIPKLGLERLVVELCLVRQGVWAP